MPMHGAYFVLALLAISMFNFIIWYQAIYMRQAVWLYHMVLCMFLLQCFSVYTGLRQIWPMNNWKYYALAWTTGIGLCVWATTVFFITQTGRPKISESFLTW